ncbi:mitochondrial ribosomal protein S5 [Brevipalpus obovatus]|uniref:mitochondrial ribosomal protein S5 n=1 Tax=Brevipalpus obovatus TaxID=246614 RepID=UPI003D9DD54E
MGFGPCLRTVILSQTRRSPSAAINSTLLTKQILFGDCFSNHQIDQIRWSTSFFMRFPAKDLWKSVTSVSSAGRKKGRGKGAGATRAKDLNKGQLFGTGPINVSWPGLNSSILKGREVSKIQELPKNPEFKRNLAEVRDRQDTFVRKKVHPLERGWSGGFTHGKWYSAADFFEDQTLKTFHFAIVNAKFRITCVKDVGKTPDLRTVTILGNRNGCIGLGIGVGINQRESLRASLDSASQSLLYVPISDHRTIHHDFSSRLNATVVFAHKMPEGYGLVCHRVIRAICIAAGIKDIHARNVGAETNYINIARAFVMGLYKQRDFQGMADEKKLHLVEFKEENGWFPRVLASPKDGQVRTSDQISKDESTDFHMYLNNGNVIEEVPKKYPDYTRTLGYGKFLLAHHYERSRLKTRCELRARYGAVESFLTLREKEERKLRKQQLLTTTAAELNAESELKSDPETL